MINFFKNIYFYILEVFTSSDLTAPVVETVDLDKIAETDDLSLPIHSIDLTSEYSELIKNKTNYIQFKYLVVNQNPKDLLLSVEYNTYSGFGWTKKTDDLHAVENVTNYTKDEINSPVFKEYSEEDFSVEVDVTPKVRASDVKKFQQYQLDQFEFEKADGNYYINIKTIDINPIDKLDSSVKMKVDNIANIKGLKSYITYFTI